MIIGITGGIGSGKSTFSELLRKNGFHVYDTDTEARRLQNEHPQIRTAIVALFGKEAYNENGLNRKFVADIVFAQPELLQKLNAIVHPVVKADFVEWRKKYADEQLLFLECAILFEGDFHLLVDRTLLITASEEVRIKRVMKRDSLSKEQVVARMKHQMSESEKFGKADFVVDTDDNGDLNVKLKKFLTEL